MFEQILISPHSFWDCSGHTAVNVGKSKIVLFGGLVDKKFLNDVIVYDIGTVSLFSLDYWAFSLNRIRVTGCEIIVILLRSYSRFYDLGDLVSVQSFFIARLNSSFSGIGFQVRRIELT